MAYKTFADNELLMAADLNQMQAYYDKAVFAVAFTQAATFNYSSSSTTVVSIPELSTSFAAENGHKYRITTTFKTVSSTVADVVGFSLFVNGVSTAGVSRTACSSPSVANTGNDHIMIYTYQATSTGTINLTFGFNRPAGTGVSRVLSETNARATVTVERLGVL